MGQVAIYCRVSTDDQSCGRQERDLRAYAKRAGHHIVAVFKETASGARNDRAERKKVMALAQAREIDAILVTELSRWGRSAGAGDLEASRAAVATLQAVWPLPYEVAGIGARNAIAYASSNRTEWFWRGVGRRQASK